MTTTPAPGNSKPDSAYSSCAGAFAPSRSWYGRLAGESYPVAARGLGCRRYRVCQPPTDAIYAIGTNTRGCYNVWRIDRATGKSSKLAFIPSSLYAITGDSGGLYIAHARYRVTDDGPFATLTALDFDGNIRWRIDQSEIPLHVDSDDPYSLAFIGQWKYGTTASLAVSDGVLFVHHGMGHEYWSAAPPYYGACISDWLAYKYPGIGLVAMSTADGSLIWKAGHISGDIDPYSGGASGDPVFSGGRLFVNPTTSGGGNTGYLDPRPDQITGSNKPCNCQRPGQFFNAELDPATGQAIQVWGADHAGGPGSAIDGSIIYKLGYFGGNYLTRIPSSWPCANKNRPPDGHWDDGVLWVLNRQAVAFAASSTGHIYALHNEGPVTLARWDESRASGSNYYANGPSGDGATVSDTGDEVWSTVETNIGSTGSLYTDTDHNVYYLIVDYSTPLLGTKTLKSRDENGALRWQTSYPLCDTGGSWLKLWVP